MTTSRVKSMALSVAAAVVSGVAVAAPGIWGTFALNGRVGILVGEQIYDASQYVVQKYDPAESAWRTVEGMYGVRTRGDNYYWLLESPDQTARGTGRWRIRLTADPDAESSWTEMTVNSSTPITGAVSFASQYEGSTPGGCAFDGSLATYFEPANHETKWIMLDFGEKKLVSGISYVPRSNYGGGSDTLRTASFQSSETGTFEDAVTLHQIPGDQSQAWDRHDIVLEEPVLTRYMRLAMAVDSGYWFNVAEIQFSEALQVVTVDQETGLPQINLGPCVRDGAVTVYRALGEGDFEAIGEMASDEASFRDESLPWGVSARYKVSAFPDYVVTYIRSHQIDRKASDQSKTFNCTPFIRDYGTLQNGAAESFDGNPSTYANTYDYDWDWVLYNPRVGVDYGETIRAHVTKCRLLPCADWVSGRSVGLAVFGSNTLDNFPEGAVQLSGQVEAASPQQWVELNCNGADAYRYIFVRHPTADARHSWCGNVAEIQFYGWTTYDEDEADGLLELVGADEETGAPTLTFAKSYPGAGGVAVFRAEAEDGQYERVGTVAPGVRTWTDPKARFYTENWYRIAKIAADGTVGPLCNRRVSYRKMYHLERLADKTTFREGCSLFGKNYPEVHYYNEAQGPYELGPELAFDGNLSSNPDIWNFAGNWVLENPAIGIDFGEEVQVAKCRLAPFANYRSRINGLAVFGTNDPNEIAQGGVQLSQAVTDTGATWLEIDCAAAQAYRYVYVRSTTQGWCGNVSEVEFYGWKKSEGRKPGLVIIVR